MTEIRCAVAGFDAKWAFSSPGRPAGFLGSARFDPLNIVRRDLAATTVLPRSSARTALTVWAIASTARFMSPRMPGASAGADPLPTLRHNNLAPADHILLAACSMFEPFPMELRKERKEP